MDRREFLKRAAATTAGLALGAGAGGCGDDDGVPPPSGGGGPPEGSVAHLLPTVNHDRILLKASFVAPQSPAPDLFVNGRRFTGRQTDSQGYFWVFDAGGLEPGRVHRLDLRRRGTPLTEAWDLATFPAPDAAPARFRVLAYTCAGGHDIFPFLHVSTPIRQRLLRRGLAYAPDAVIANGDHVYWDLRAGTAAQTSGGSEIARDYAGEFDRTAAVLGTPNEAVLKRAVGEQIAGLYGTMYQSTPVFFLRDDHDYFEDDQVTAELTTFPPDAFMVDLARSSQWLYYPEFLPDPARPGTLPGSGAADRPRGVSEGFGTIRYGRLFEGLLYDCKGFMNPAGDAATLLPAAVEEWLVARMRGSNATHLVNLPSNPPGWTAGKYGEWYPEILGPDGTLTPDLPKPGWARGWLAQHDRLLAAAAAMPRLPLFVSGDIHSIAEGRILRSGEHDFGANPIVSVITGPPGTGVGWPSAARGTRAMPPRHIDLEPIVPLREINGFHLIDFEPEVVTIRHFRWSKRDPVDSIDTLEPFAVSEHPV